MEVPKKHEMLEGKLVVNMNKSLFYHKSIKSNFST